MKDVKNMTALELIELLVSLNENLMNVAGIKANQSPVVAKAEVKAEPAKEEVKAEEPTSEGGVTQSVLEALILEVRAKHGVAHTRAVIKDYTGVTSLQKIEVPKYEGLFKLLQAELERDLDAKPKTEPDVTTAKEMIEAEAAVAKTEVVVDRDLMKSLLIELSQSEKGDGKPTNYAKSKEIISEIGKAPKLAEIPDENVNAVIYATKTALDALNEDEDL